MIYENASLLTESQRFADSDQRIGADIDLDHENLFFAFAAARHPVPRIGQGAEVSGI